MEDEESSPLAPQLKGVVIITLPPPDDPAQGKTITAYTISTAPQFQQHQSQIRQQSTPRLRSSPASFLRKPLIGLLSAALLVLFLWAWVSYEETFDFLRASEDQGEEEIDRQKSSYLFPLYPKSVRGEEVNLKLKLNAAGLEVDGGVKRRRKIVRSSSVGAVNSSALFPVRGNIFPDGLYYTIIDVGNPPKSYFLDVDTGSDLTWIQCDAPCSSCAQGPNPLYKPTRSKLVPSGDSLCQEVQSNQWNLYCDSCSQCDYEIEYADHSSSLGVLARDELPLKMDRDDMTNPSIVFGCAYDQKGQLLDSPAKTDGILGLSGSKVGLPSQLANQNIISNVLGHCIADKESTGGYMFLGDEFVPHWSMTWVPMLSSPVKFYQAEVRKLSYGEKQIGPGGKGSELAHVVFDTGSSYSYFTNAAYTALLASLKERVDVLVEDDTDLTLPICWQGSAPIRSVEDVKQLFKPLTFHFRNSWLLLPRVLVIRPEDYLVISKKGNVCLGILNGTDVHDGSLNILGDISLRGKLFVYDNIEQKIGWVRSDCAEPQKPVGFSVFF